MSLAEPDAQLQDPPGLDDIASSRTGEEIPSLFVYQVEAIAVTGSGAHIVPAMLFW